MGITVTVDTNLSHWRNYRQAVFERWLDGEFPEFSFASSYVVDVVQAAIHRDYAVAMTTHTWQENSATFPDEGRYMEFVMRYG